jgi:hypothetical protein
VKNPSKLKSQSSAKKFCERSESIDALSEIPTKCLNTQITGGSYHKPINTCVNDNIAKPDDALSPKKFTSLFEKIKKFLEENQSAEVNYVVLHNHVSGSYLI